METQDVSQDEINSMEVAQYQGNGFYEIVRERLMADVQPSFDDYDGRTLLHLGGAKGGLEISELLMINLAVPMFKYQAGSPQTDEAVKNGGLQLLPILQGYRRSLLGKHVGRV